MDAPRIVTAATDYVAACCCSIQRARYNMRYIHKIIAEYKRGRQAHIDRENLHNWRYTLMFIGRPV